MVPTSGDILCDWTVVSTNINQQADTYYRQDDYEAL